MINHVVLFKLKEFPDAEKQEVIGQLKSKLLALKGKISVLKHIEVNENYELDAKSFDIALFSHFENLDDLESYRVHPEHQQVLAYIGEVTSARAAVDYRF